MHAPPLLTALTEAKNRFLNVITTPVVILLYHRVTTLSEDPQMLAVSPENFRAHVRYLKENYPILRLEEDLSKVREPAVVISFDDGYADNAQEALPILEEFGVPATFFVSTGAVDSRQEFWWDELERLLLARDRNFPVSFSLENDGIRKTWPTTCRDERESLYLELHQWMKKVDAEGREMWLCQLRNWAGAESAGRETHRPLSLEELCRLARSPFATIGAHAVTHTPLAILKKQRQREEILGSKRMLESWLGGEIRVFSYPFGGKGDYNRDSVGISKAAGFAKAVANAPGQARLWTDSFQLPRQLVRNWPLGVFAEKLKRFWYL